MAHFLMPKDKAVSVEEMENLGIFDFRIYGDGYIVPLQAVSQEQVEAMETRGFMRADIFEYVIDPEPDEADRPPMVKALGQMPCTTGPSYEAFTGIQVTFCGL